MGGGQGGGCGMVGVGGELHCGLWNGLPRLQARDIAMGPHTTLLAIDEREVNEQSHVTGCD